MKRTHLSVPESVDDLIEEFHIQSAMTDVVPRLSKADVQRAMLAYAARDLVEGETDGDLFADGGIDDEALMNLVPEPKRVLFNRERFVENEARLRSLRTGFEKRWKQHFKERFEGGIKQEQLDEFAINAREDVRILFPDPEEYADRREELLNWIDRVVEHAKIADDMSTYDPLAPETLFDSYEGVEEGGEWESVTREEFAELAEDARHRLGGSGPVDPDAIATMLHNSHGVPEEVAQNAADAGRRMLARGIDTLDVDKLALADPTTEDGETL